MTETEALNFKETYENKVTFINSISTYLNDNYDLTYNNYKTACDYILTRVYFYYYKYYLNASTKEDFERLFTFTLSSKLDFYNNLLQVYNSKVSPRLKEERLSNSKDTASHTSKGEQTSAVSPENYNDFDTDAYITNKNKHDNTTSDNLNHDFTSSVLNGIGLTLKDINLIPMKISEDIVKTFAKHFIAESSEETSYPLVYQNLSSLYYKLLDYISKLPSSEELQREIDVINSSLDGIITSINDLDSRLNDDETNIATLTTSITSINSQLATINLSLEEIKLVIDSHTKQLETTTSSIFSINEHISTLETNLENVEKSLSNYTTFSYIEENYYNKTEVDEKISSITPIDTYTRSEIDTMISTINDTISTLQTSLTTLTATLEEVKEQSNNAYALATSNAEKIQNNTTEISTNTSNITSLDRRVTALESSGSETKLYRHKITLLVPNIGSYQTTEKTTWTNVYPFGKVKKLTGLCFYGGYLSYSGKYSSTYIGSIPIVFLDEKKISYPKRESSVGLECSSLSFSDEDYYTYEVEEIE